MAELFFILFTFHILYSLSTTFFLSAAVLPALESETNMRDFVQSFSRFLARSSPSRSAQQFFFRFIDRQSYHRSRFRILLSVFPDFFPLLVQLAIFRLRRLSIPD